MFRRAMQADPVHRVPLLEEAVAADDIAWSGLPGLADAWEELADAYAATGAPDLAIRAMEMALQAGWTGVPDHRTKLAEYHLAAGRIEQALQLLQAARADDPTEIWLFNAAGMMFADHDLHTDAVTWLGEGIEIALEHGDPDDVLEQLVELRAESIFQLGDRPDPLQLRAVDYLNAHEELPFDDAPAAWPIPRRTALPVTLSFFPGAELVHATARWPELDEPSYDAYVRRLEGVAKWLSAAGVPIHGFAPLHLNRYLGWAADEGLDPGEGDTRAIYATRIARLGDAIAWPPGRNDLCWCGSQRKYKRCCFDAPAVGPPANDDRPG